MKIWHSELCKSISILWILRNLLVCYTNAEKCDMARYRSCAYSQRTSSPHWWGAHIPGAPAGCAAGGAAEVKKRKQKLVATSGGGVISKDTNEKMK